MTAPDPITSAPLWQLTQQATGEDATALPRLARVERAVEAIREMLRRENVGVRVLAEVLVGAADVSRARHAEAAAIDVALREAGVPHTSRSPYGGPYHGDPHDAPPLSRVGRVAYLGEMLARVSEQRDARLAERNLARDVAVRVMKEATGATDAVIDHLSGSVMAAKNLTTAVQLGLVTPEQAAGALAGRAQEKAA